MKKLLTACILMFMLIGVSSPALTQAKVMWGNQEVVKGQIGKATVVKATDLFKKQGNGKYVKVRMLKAGEAVRVFSLTSTMYYVGSSQYVKKSANVKYQVLPASVKQQFGVTVTKKSYKGMTYPQVQGLASKQAEARINRTLLMHAQRSYNSSIEVKKQEVQDKKNWGSDPYWIPYSYYQTYELKYNAQNKLSVIMYDGVYLGGAHGTEWATGYNFDINTGNRYSLISVLKNHTYDTEEYIYNKLAYDENYFVESRDDITVNNDNAFYFQNNGVAIMFTEYEIASYAMGMPAIFVPSTVYNY
ncbi:DUF3298 and DUF4163 domain-containing protein [Priestia koreensis]|uniref:DUF3298 domain-containing protein n=1 Tax=Priestia koreensis TaxID=284581 RepID=A0A0M0LH49_9BACI|nr:DUF3298 and DUF4163 domain-containing protein [Priestia koreensis]KOO50410.1 hypothetical protein AMD01_01235 [Priestia koreensis]